MHVLYLCTDCTNSFERAEHHLGANLLFLSVLYRMNKSTVSIVLAILACANGVSALNQPDGTPIPQGNGLQGLFNNRGENINALASASKTPERFVPSCALTFTVLQRNAGYDNAFGWYNVTGSKPTSAELHEFLACSDAVGTTKVLDIKNDPNYAGGEIGFYEGVVKKKCNTLSTYDYVFYSEPKYNPDVEQASPFIHLLIYNSTVTNRAFYFGWEDLLSGGDNDFDDLTTFVTGITCSGGGAPCNTGKDGICSEGTMQCQNGMITCLQSSPPATETCDGVDNDCNGSTDEGDICPAGKTCDQGTCVPKCGGGEFVCAPWEVCTPSGLCVESACAEVTCPAGLKCRSGQCMGPCDGITCPHGQVCRVGACMDPCNSIACDSGQVCVAGVCTDGCGCGGCATGQTCQPDERCITDACGGKTCNEGEYCDVNGACQDACTDAVCPEGQVCTAGQCVTAAPSDSSSGGFVGAGGVAETGGSGGIAQAGMGGAGAIMVSSGGNARESGTCGCRSVGEKHSRLEGMIAILAAAFAIARRKAGRSM